MDELIEPPYEDEIDEWEEPEEDWGEDWEGDEMDEMDELEPPEINIHQCPPVPVSCNNVPLKIGDKIKIVGNISESKKIVYINYHMEKIINDDKTYRVTEIHKNGRDYVVHAAGWNWGIKNIMSLKEAPVIDPKPFLFDESHLDL